MANICFKTCSNQRLRKKPLARKKNALKELGIVLPRLTRRRDRSFFIFLHHFPESLAFLHTLRLVGVVSYTPGDQVFFTRPPIPCMWCLWRAIIFQESRNEHGLFHMVIKRQIVFWLDSLTDMMKR